MNKRVDTTGEIGTETDQKDLSLQNVHSIRVSVKVDLIAKHGQIVSSDIGKLLEGRFYFMARKKKRKESWRKREVIPSEKE